MADENVEIARRAYEQFAAGDVEGVATLIAPQAEMPDAGGLGVERGFGTVRGPEGFISATEEAVAAFEDYTVEAEEFIDAGETVIVAVRISGRGRASGAPLDVHLAHSWKFRDGKVIRGEVYRTTEEALAAVNRRAF